jgi:hypothetical protein
MYFLFFFSAINFTMTVCRPFQCRLLFATAVSKSKCFFTIQVKVPEWLDPPFTEAEIQTITHVVPIKDVR